MKNLKSLIIAVLFGTLIIANNSFAADGLEEKAGDLVETLKGDGPFTVFAPTNEAFAALPEGTLEALLMPKNRDELVEILKYHVVPGKVLSSDLSDGMKAKTVEGSDITVHINDSGV